MQIKDILKQHNFRFNKQFGQNFLTDVQLLDEIVQLSGITKEDVVLEIGAGAGTLTGSICRAAKRVVAFEIDRNLQSILAITLANYNNCEVVMADVMKQEVSAIEKQYTDNKPYKVVANIPYYITTPLIMKFVEGSDKVASLTLTIQKEVAQRLCAKENTKDYGAITVAVQAVADVSLIKVLDRTLFYPVPNVDSAVINIKMNRNKHNIDDIKLFGKTTRCAFAMRRKTLVNNLVNTFGIDRVVAENILADIDLPSNIRGESLSVEKMVELSNVLASKNIR